MPIYYCKVKLAGRRGLQPRMTLADKLHCCSRLQVAPTRLKAKWVCVGGACSPELHWWNCCVAVRDCKSLLQSPTKPYKAATKPLQKLQPNCIPMRVIAYSLYQPCAYWVGNNISCNIHNIFILPNGVIVIACLPNGFANGFGRLWLHTSNHLLQSCLISQLY